MTLLRGYGRLQGIVFRPDDVRFVGKNTADFIKHIKQANDCLMVNRNQGSGTRILIDQLLQGVQPPGYAIQSRSHNAVAAAVSQQRADWGVAIRTVADAANLAFVPLSEEQYDFVVPETCVVRTAKPAGGFRHPTAFDRNGVYTGTADRPGLGLAKLLLSATHCRLKNDLDLPRRKSPSKLI